MGPTLLMLGMIVLALIGAGMVVVGLVLRRRGRRNLSADAVLLGCGGLLVPTGIALAVFLPPGLRSHEAMLEAGRSFVEVVRRGDRGAIVASAAPNAALDEAYLREVVQPSRDVKMGSSVSGSDHGCVRLALLPGKQQLVLTFVKLGDRWAVQSASEHHAECEDSLDGP